MQDRDEYLALVKKRALAYLDAGEKPVEAFTSMASDLANHPDLKSHRGVDLGLQLLMIGNLQSPHEMRRFIEGFN